MKKCKVDNWFNGKLMSSFKKKMLNSGVSYRIHIAEVRILSMSMVQILQKQILGYFHLATPSTLATSNVPC